MLRSTIRLLAPALISLPLLLGVAGCSTGERVDYENGRALFIERCGTCHALDEAATTASVGPDLDAAFAEARNSGMDSDTIEGVVAQQIDVPREVSPENTRVYMPPDLVTGDDATDVAYYVGQVAGVPGIKPPQVQGGPGAQVFANNGCGSCHTLEALPDAVGTAGPNLTETLAGQDAKQIEQSIVAPDSEIVQGFPDIMPTTYGETIPPDELEDLVAYLEEEANAGGKK